MKKEIRQVNDINVNDDRLVSGYAVVFDSESIDLGFREVIHRGAITEQTIKDSDILCKFNHDDSKVLARCKFGEGSLKLTVDERGLKYEFDAPKTALGDELLEYLNRGDLASSSFAFSVQDGFEDDRWTKTDDGEIRRDIYRIERLYDVSPVFQPAYEATSCETSKRFESVKNTSKEIDSIMSVMEEEINKL